MTSTLDASEAHEGDSPGYLPPETGPTEAAILLLEQWKAQCEAGQVERPDGIDVAMIDQALSTIRSLQTETAGLRRALTSRATIDQAKGMIMAERHCGADEAFQLLAKMSKDTNVPLKDVASALVYLASRAE